MVRLWVALGILSVVAGFALGAGQAQAKRKGLSEAARSFLLRSVCDLPDRKYGPRAIAEAKVVLEDAKGLKYAAGHCRWCSPSSYLNEQFRGALSAMAVTSGRSKPQRKPSPSLTVSFEGSSDSRPVKNAIRVYLSKPIRPP